MITTQIRCVLTATLFGLAASLSADAGKSSANFLKMGVGGRGVAMGDAQTAATDDVMSVFWNPAGLAELYQNEVGFMHNSSVQGVSQDVVYYALPTNSANVWAVGLSHLSISGINGRDSFDGLTGDIPASDTLISLSWARPWDELPWFGGLQTGVNVKFLRKILDQDSALGYMGISGFCTRRGARGLRDCGRVWFCRISAPASSSMARAPRSRPRSNWGRPTRCSARI
ncbi:MAG: UPF0164 family protein [Elusimicrobia bacterium]|nr:UPF0164 family protein [Elusimicrobiota bacterium]